MIKKFKKGDVIHTVENKDLFDAFLSTGWEEVKEEEKKPVEQAKPKTQKRKETKEK